MSETNHYTTCFQIAPSVRVGAPGRINLIGEHVDYLGGSVMPIAIARHLTVDAGLSPDDKFRILPVGLGISDPVEFEIEDCKAGADPGHSWLNYVFGVISGYRGAGVQVPAFQAAISSTLPTGAGLSSSAALETAIALVIEALTGVEQDVVDRALICQKAEHDFAGVPCGIMDQLAVGAGKAGHALLLDCSDLSYSNLPIPDGIAVLTADTGVKHALGDGEYRKRRENCESALGILAADSFRGLSLADIETAKEVLGDLLFRRARHAVTEMARVDAFANALKQGDIAPLGRLMRESHESLRSDFDVSCVELDRLVEAAYEFGPERGLIGSRMTGGGFGGSTVSLVAAESADELKNHLEKFYREKFARDLNCFVTSAVDGAGFDSV
ncbi:galactokinase [Verrucomicrobiales bacterium]|nr:galactokinase [Verrucomicrobiales bacterium]